MHVQEARTSVGRAEVSASLADGRSVGTADGSSVGTIVGCSEGDWLGMAVGAADGTSVEFDDGAKLGCTARGRAERLEMWLGCVCPSSCSSMHAGIARGRRLTDAHVRARVCIYL